MSSSGRMSVDDYPALACCVSDLRKCSADDSDPNSVTFMFEPEHYLAIDFDRVMRGHCEGLSPDGMTSGVAVARSVDALYVGRDTGAWDNVLSLIEFKNGSLYSRKHVLSKGERREFKQGLVSAINKALKDAGEMEWEIRVALEDSLEKVVDEYVNVNLGKLQAKGRDIRGSHHRQDSFTLETIKSKAAFSALLLQCVLDVPTSFIRNHVDMVLVYNPDKNPDSEVKMPRGDNTVPRVQSVEVGFPSMLARYAGRPYNRFGLKDSIGPFFHNVYTCTAEELCELLDRQGQ